MRKHNQIHTLGASHYKAHFRCLRKLKDFKWTLWSEKYGNGVAWILKVPWGFLVFLGEMISCSVCWCVFMKIFRSLCCIQVPSRPVSCTGGWVQLIAGKKVLIVFASLVVHCCAIKERYCCITVIRCGRSTVHSIERRPPLKFCSLFKRITLGTLFQI